MKELKRYHPMDPCFLRVGRYDHTAAVYGLWWSGSGVSMLFSGSYMEAEICSTARDHASWMGVMMDGAPVARFPLKEGKHTYPVLAGLAAGVTHEVTLLRDSQPSYDEDGPIELLAILADAPVECPEKKPLMLEFLGDSLTVGEGTLGPVSAQEWRQVWISHMPAFPTLVSSALNAEKRVIALGGWGAYKSWDCNHDSRIGAIYEKLCAVTPGGNIPYDFSERPADAVIINLGTNDGSALSKADPEELPREIENLIGDAVQLLKTVRAHQPKAFIFWAYGLCGVGTMEPLRMAVEQYRKEMGDTRAVFLPLPDAGGDVGSRSHPSRDAHRRAAETIIQAIRDVVKE